MEDFLIKDKEQRRQEKLTINVVAKTLWGEARGENIAGKNAVASVIYNRYKISQTKGGYWWGNSLIDICQQPHQFSCWNINDVNYDKIQNINEDDLSFQECQRIARRLVRGLLIDITDGSDHYHNIFVHPKWAEDSIITCQFGTHLFYRMVK